MIEKTVLHYKIVSELGAGGMGVVYKAEDTKLDRTVALKFLPAHALTNEEEKTRFIQEAKSAASLSHANIAHIYEINEHEGSLFIAMEYIEGETLAEKIKKAPFKIKDAMKIAKQVADGLAAAHEQGTVHRDIKAANIMITPKGVAKIMDFGLAKMASGSMVTKVGTTLGTISYMSPEQSQGEAVDHRTDIWSLGVLLYEMVSGQLPFKGEYENAIIYSIMHVDPEPLTAVRTGVPMQLERIVNKLLAKDPDDRYQNIVELPVDLKSIDLQEFGTSRLHTSSVHDSVIIPKAKKRKITGWQLNTAVLVIAIAATFLITKNFAAGDGSALREVIYSQIAERTRDDPPGVFTVAISRDGKYTAYTDVDEDGVAKLFLKSLNEVTAIPLQGTDNAAYPIFSPDGKWIAFFDGNRIAKIQREGGSVIPIAPTTVVTGMRWLSNDVIIYSGNYTIKTVSSIGGADPEDITIPESFIGLRTFPVPVPGTNKLLCSLVKGENFDQAEVIVYDMDTQKTASVFTGGIAFIYTASGHLIYVAGSRTDMRVMVTPFDIKTFAMTGTPIPMPIMGKEGGDISLKGTAITVLGNAEFKPRERLVLVDRSGEIIEELAEGRDIRSPRFSADGKTIVAEFWHSGKSDLWLIDSETKVTTTLTNSGNIVNPVWGPGASNITYNKDLGTRSDAFRLALDGTQKEERLLERNDRTIVSSWSGDGSHLLYYEIRAGNRSIYSYAASSASVTPFVATEADEYAPDFSPNGKWVVYNSNVSGERELYIKPFPPTQAVINLASGGGTEPVWSPKGDEIFYKIGDKMIAAKLSFTPALSVAGRETLFSRTVQGNILPEYDVHPDGDKFAMVIAQGAEPGNTVILIQNFFTLLNEIAPADRE